MFSGFQRHSHVTGIHVDKITFKFLKLTMKKYVNFETSHGERNVLREANWVWLQVGKGMWKVL